jgi:hypothetical protein
LTATDMLLMSKGCENKGPSGTADVGNADSWRQATSSQFMIAYEYAGRYGLTFVELGGP